MTRSAMRRPIRWSGGLLFALAVIGSCGKDKTTALDIKLEITGALDQVRIDTVSLDGIPVVLADEPTTLFPASPRMLKTGDVLTVWFLDGEDTKMAVVSATGRLCGRDASAQATTPARALVKGQTVQTTLTLANNGTACAGTGTGGAGGRGGTGGAAGAGGAAGTGGTGTGGTGGGAAGSAGTGGGVGGMAGTIGSAGSGGGTAGRGGTTGSAGTGGGAAGRGGTTGSAGTGGGAAGRGGTTGSAGTGGGAAGRGGTTGSAGTGGGAAGRGGTTGSAGTGGGAAGRGGAGGATGSGGGTGTACATSPLQTLAQPVGLFSQTAGCGYTGSAQTVDNILTPIDYFAFASGVAFANTANCGRCVELVRNSTITGTKRVTVTLVGSCTDAVCIANPNQARFQVSTSAYQILAPTNESSLPLAGETLSYSFVPCPAPQNQPILANIRIASGAPATVLFVQQRYGIAAVTVEDVTTAQQYSMARGNDAYWYPPTGMTLPQSARFRLTDVNNALVTSGVFTTANTPAFASAGTQFPTCP